MKVILGYLEGRPWLPGVFETSLCFMRPCLKN